MNPKASVPFFLFLMGFLCTFSVTATEFTDGSVRLVLRRETGRFSLYSLHENNRQGPLALFADQDPRTSFLSVMVNDRSYKMGDSSAFRIHLRADNRNPSFIFESSFLLVTQEFSFVRTANSAQANGILIRVTLENRGDRQISAGARFLLDTHLGEGPSGVPFTTNLRTVNTETLLTRTDNDNFWTDRNNRGSLTGSLNTGSPEDPDSVHFANWQKLNEVSWKAPYQPGRNFNLPPYSVGDTAICYYFEPRPLGRGEKRSFGFYLALNNESGFGTQSAVSGREIIQDLSTALLADSREQDLASIMRLTARIDALIASGAASEDELAAIEFTLNRLRAKYAGSVHSR